MCSKVPIILYFVKQKRPSGNCYASCFFTEKTPLLLENYSGMLQIENIGTIKVAIGTSGWGIPIGDVETSRKKVIKCL